MKSMRRNVLPIEQLKRQFRNRFKKASISLDRPRNACGVWYLDINQEGHPVVVQWQAKAGFGVSSSPSHVYGERADEVYPDEEATYGRVVSLLLSRTYTAQTEPVRLRDLRKERGLSQAELADLLKKQQGEISKLERRSDVLVSTLRDVIQSMGGQLRLTAQFPDGSVWPLEIGETAASANSQDPTAVRK